MLDAPDGSSAEDTGTLAFVGNCTIYNTVFFEGIPVLSRNGLMILILRIAGVGAVGFRRFI